MSSKRVALAKPGERSIVVENDATAGAIFGVNLRWPTGELVRAEDFVAPPSEPGLSVVYWRMLREIPPNVVALADTITTGLYAITAEGESATRSIDVAAGELTVARADGVDGNPLLGLADVEDSSEGALFGIQRDSKGRVTGTVDATITGTDGEIEVENGNAADGPPTISLADVTPTAGGTLQRYGFDAKGRRTEEEEADTDDLAEGSTNLYYTDARADARITAQKGQPGGLATLDADAKLEANQLPALAITDTFVVNTEAAMLALDAQQGDVAVRTDEQKSYILTADPASTLGNWQELLTPTGTGGTVTSVALGVPTGFTVSGSPITSSGTITVSYDTGYQGYTSAEASKLSGIASGATVGADWSVNLSNIPANISLWASVAPSDKADASALSSYLPLAGGTMTGHLIIGNAYDLRLDSPTPATRIIRWNTGGVNRWAAYTNSTSESGGNAGSNFVMRRYADDGSGLSPDPYTINRATGVISFGLRPEFAGAVPWDSANFDLTSTGLNGNTPPTITNLDTVLGTNTRFFRWTSSGSTGAPASAGPAIYLPYSSNAGAMLAFQPTAESFFFRTQPTSGSWNPWRQVWHTGNLADSGWVALTLNSGWANIGSPYQTAAVRKFGGFVKLRGQINVSSGTAFTLPAGYRPPGRMEICVASGSTVDSARARVESNGNVTFIGVGLAVELSLDSISFYID